jgi:hypothetical protein
LSVHWRRGRRPVGYQAGGGDCSHRRRLLNFYEHRNPTTHHL